MEFIFLAIGYVIGNSSHKPDKEPTHEYRRSPLNRLIMTTFGALIIGLAPWVGDFIISSYGPVETPRTLWAKNTLFHFSMSIIFGS